MSNQRNHIYLVMDAGNPVAAFTLRKYLDEYNELGHPRARERSHLHVRTRPHGLANIADEREIQGASRKTSRRTACGSVSGLATRL